MDDALLELEEAPTVSVYAAAVLLGHGEFAIRQAIEDGTLAAVRLGRNIRVPSAAIRKLLGVG